MGTRLEPEVPLPELIGRAVQQNPYVALAAATGVGLLFGGGFGGRLLGSAVEAAGRVAGAMFLSTVLDRQPDDGEEGDLTARDSRVRARPPF